MVGLQVRQSRHTIQTIINPITRLPNYPIPRFSLLISLLLLVACGPSPTPAGKDAVLWRRVGSWSGRGNTQTGSFSVETGALRLQWQTSNPPAGGGAFKLSLHSAISGRPLQVVVDHRGQGRDTTYIEDEPRVSYFVVESADIDWAFTLEEAVQATSNKR